MNFNKKYKGTVNTSLTINTNANPLTGITTSFDGILVSSNKRVMIGFSTSLSVLGVAATNQGIILNPGQILDLPYDPVRRIGMFSTETSCQVNCILYEEEL